MGILLAGSFARRVTLCILPDPDTWWHIAVGQHIIDTHRWPTSDPYSFTAPGVHWIAYEWLGEVAMALAARMGGLLGIQSCRSALVAIVTLLLYYYAYVRCGNWKAACVATGLLLPIASVIFSSAASTLRIHFSAGDLDLPGAVPARALQSLFGFSRLCF